MKFNFVPKSINYLVVSVFFVLIHSTVFSNEGIGCEHFKRTNRCFESKIECAKLEAAEERDKCYKMMGELIAKVRQDEEKVEQYYEKKLKREIDSYKREHEEKLLKKKRKKEERERKDSIAEGVGIVTIIGLTPFISPFGAGLIGCCASVVARNCMGHEDDS